jgi:hypothetical protein
MFSSEEFAVYKLTDGEVVIEEWTGKKHILRFF